MGGAEKNLPGVWSRQSRLRTIRPVYFSASTPAWQAMPSCWSGAAAAAHRADHLAADHERDAAFGGDHAVERRALRRRRRPMPTRSSNTLVGRRSARRRAPCAARSRSRQLAVVHPSRNRRDRRTGRRPRCTCPSCASWILGAAGGGLLGGLEIDRFAIGRRASLRHRSSDWSDRRDLAKAPQRINSATRWRGQVYTIALSSP